MLFDTNSHDVKELIYEMFHSILHMAQSQIQDVKTTKYGRISSYDPEKHAVKVMIPQDRDEDDEPYETDWIPLGSVAVGDKFGMQLAPKGGATKDEPDKGELVAVTVVQRNTGLMKAAHVCYDDTLEPPGSGLEEESDEENKDGKDEDPHGRNKLEGGELLIRHESGSFCKFYQNGDMQVFCVGDMDHYVKKTLNIVVREGDANLTVEKGDVNVEVQEGDVACDVMEGDLAVLVELGDTSIETPIGDTSIVSDSGSIVATTETGDISLSATTGNITAEAVDIQVIASGIVDLIAPVVNAGNPATAQAVLKEVAALLYNSHTHTVSGGVTGPPDLQMEPGLATTVEFYAS